MSYEETFESWNRLAALYEERFFDLDIYNATYDAFCDLLKGKHPRVLEIGCGPGNLTRQLLNRLPGMKITGIDISPNMISLARKNNPAAEFLVMDARSIDGFDAGFEGIVCGFCVPYLAPADCRKMIADAARLLKPGGFFYMSFVPGEPERSGFITGTTGDRTFFYFYETGYIQEALNRSGFSTITVSEIRYRESEETDEKHVVIIARRQT